MILEFIILAGLCLGGLIFVGAFFHKRLGIAIWPFILLLVPASLILIYAEAEVARGALAMILGSLWGAYGIAVMIAVGMLFCAHLLGDCLHDYFEADFDYGSSPYQGHSWRPTQMTLAITGYLFFSIVYGILGYIRTGYTFALLGPGAVPFLGRFVFFLYPVVSFILGFFTAKAIRSMSGQLKRWKRAQSLLHAARVALIGRASNDETKRILAMVEVHALHGDDPLEVMRETARQIEHYSNIANLDRDQPPGVVDFIPATSPGPSQGNAKNNGDIEMDNLLLSSTPESSGGGELHAV